MKPLLHDLVPAVAAPTMAFSGADGQIRHAGVQGVFHADVRVIAAAVLRLDGHEPASIGHAPAGSGTIRFVAVAGAARVRRTRTVRPGLIAEEIEITGPVTATVTVDLALDHTPIELVRAGLATSLTEPVMVTVTGELTWPVSLAAGERVVLRWSAAFADPVPVLLAGPRGGWARPEVHARDRRLERLVGRSLDDLAALRLTTPADDGDTFLGAGAPWYLTLFGRDSLWAARMMLPLGTGLAVETLRVLGRRQGTATDPVTGEAPGKILHELRRAQFVLPGQGITLPPVYYGTIDATPLWISLLHDAWRWGHAPAEIEALLPRLEAALGWLGGHAGFLAYVDTSGTGLANQGWKDSADAVRFHDGRLADAPIALAEVQGYAYRAAMDGAALLDAFGRPGGDRWRAYAKALASRFRAAFWVSDGRYPALALDAGGRPVDSLTSNIGHLLGTGMLTGEEEARVAAALASAGMSGGYGLRTMSADDGGFAPYSYHCGSIWTHDTAIAAAGLAGGGFATEAAALIDGLLSAAEAFDFQLPELYAGDARADLSRPMPYPTACRPQAWSAAAAILILRAWLGLDPDVPNGRVRLRPMPDAPVVRGLRIAGHPVDFDGTTLRGLPDGLVTELV